ncbi:P27 family phage terminase small subunit [Bacillus sp. FSL W7-1360]
MATAEKLREYLGEIYEESDEELIGLYVETHAFYARLQKELKETQLMMSYTNKAGATNLVKNPLSIELTKTVQTLNNLLKSLGLTPAQRKKLRAASSEEDEFDKFD